MLWLQVSSKGFSHVHVRMCKLCLFPILGLLFLISFLTFTPPLSFLSYCGDLDEISHEGPTGLSRADSKLGLKSFMVTNLPLLQRVRQSCTLLQGDQTHSTQESKEVTSPLPQLVW